MNISYVKDRLLNPGVLFFIWVSAALVSALSKSVPGPHYYNNFRIFRGVADHFFSSQPLYGEYPLEYHDVNHYGPLFAFIIAPFAAIPGWLAVPLWVVGMAVLLYWALRQLPIETRLQCIVIWLTLNDMFSAGLLQQFNIATVALIIGSYTMIQKRKEGTAALFIVIGTFVKIYGIVGLAFFFFARRKARFILYLLIWSVVALFLPMLFVSPDYLWAQYSAWAVDIAQKNMENMFCDYTNISFIGAVRKISGIATYSDMLIIIPAAVMFLVSYLRIKQFQYTGFRLTMLASLLIFIVIFSSGSENSGYVTAAAGVGIWWVMLARRRAFEWILLALILIASFSYNLFPKYVYDNIVVAYALRSLPYTAVWLYCIWMLWSRDFSPTNAPAVTDYSHADIDIVLPCYNPDEEWVERAVLRINDLKELCPNHKFRLIVSNDGSRINFTDQYTNRLISLLPDTIVVDNKQNMGKGVTVRAGVRRTTAPLIIYTDYDLPFTTESVCRVIKALEDGCDIAMAVRNNSYHSQLNINRKSMSWISRNLNWLILGMNYPDAQAGLKGFNSRGREIFLSTRIERFLFDTEFIYKAYKKPNITIAQVYANLRQGVHLPPMSTKTMKHEALNFLKIVLRG